MGAINDKLRSQPAYPLSEAARYLKVPSATLRSWVVGRPYPTARGTGRFQPLIEPPSREPALLSFYNLIEAHVLRSLRTDHGIKIHELRKAVAFAEKTLGVKRLLLQPDLSTYSGEVFLDKYGELISLSKSGQLAMRKLLEDHLKRVEWDDWQFPVRLYPFISGERSLDRSIAIDAGVAFGRPIIKRVGVTTSVIADRLDAGETVAELASDYGLRPAEVEEAALYEHAA